MKLGGETIDSGRTNFLIPYEAWRKPIPDSFQPPIGTPRAKYVVSTSLTFTAPASMRRAICSPCSLEPENTEADSP